MPQLAKLDSSHQLIVLGAGAALNSNHSKSATLLDGTILVDTGSDPTVPLRAASVDPLDVEHIFLTHLHGDHFFGLAFMIAEGLVRTEKMVPLVVFGPAGTEEATKRLLQMAYPVSDPEMFIQARNVSFSEFSQGSVLTAGNWRVKVLKQEHGRMESYGFAFYDSQMRPVVGFSGDGRPPTATFAELARCGFVVANTPTMIEPLPAHASVQMYRDSLKSDSNIISVHRTFDAPDEASIFYPVDGATILI